MADLQSFTIELTPDLADRLRRKVASGRYASESEAVSDALLSLEDRDQPLEDWLLDEVGPAYDAWKADPSSGLSPDDVRASIAEEHDRLTRAR